MASTRYAAGPLDIRRLSTTALQVGGGAVVVWIWTWMRGSGRGVSWPMLLAGVGMVGWFLVRAVLHRHELRALVVDDRGVRIGRAVVPWLAVQEVAVLRRGHQGTTGGEPLEVLSVQNAIAAGRDRLGGSGRLVIRPSGTEPLIRVMAEGDDPLLVRTVVDDIIGALGRAAA